MMNTFYPNTPENQIEQAKRTTGHAFSKALATELGTTIENVLVLARNNDPYSIGTPANIRDAEWFESLWDRFDFSQGIHLRRIHYRMVSHGDVIQPDGTSYENTERCWQVLSGAAKCARTLGLVDPEKFVDRRNPSPHVFASNETYNPMIIVDSDPHWSVGTIQSYMPSPYFHMPTPEVVGYESGAGDQPCLIEVWIEKSTMDEELLPLCRSFGVNLVTSIGFQSITATVNLVKRTLQSCKPARVLYIADHDPAGDRMAIAVARQAQYRIEQQLGIDLDLTIEELILTPEQVRKYKLPRVPIKEKDRRRQGFEDRYGDGAVELDALEALHPGKFQKIVRKAINRYRDKSLSTRTRVAYARAHEIVADEWDHVTGPFHNDLTTMSKEADKIYLKYQAGLTELAESIRTELEPINERLKLLAISFRAETADFDPDIPDKPQAVPDGPVATDPLFDSTRGYMDQLTAFRRHKT